MPGRMIGRWQVPLQPKQLGNFHFRRNRATDIAKNVVMRVIDQAGLGGRAMVHPHDHVTAWVARRADRQRIAAGVEHHERAGCIETDAFDGGSRKCCLRHRRPHRGDTRRPDIGRRLFDDVACLMPDRDRMSRRRQQHSQLVEHTGARARCSNVDTDERLLHSSPIQDPREPTSRYSLHRQERRFRSSGLRRPMPETAQRTQLRRALRAGPLVYRRSRHHTSSDCF